MSDLHPEPPATPGPVPPSEARRNEPTPAELVPPATRRERLAWYAGTMLLSCALIFGGLRLDRADLKAPFYYNLDALLMLPLVKATAERGFGGHWRNERMGAPGILELHDFPVIDHLHFLIIWGLGRFVSNVVLLFNLYFLLTFPLTVLTAMIAFRRLGLTLAAAAVGGLLFAFLPFHYQRWENHYFLAAYWVVPLSLLPVFAVTRGDVPFFRREPDGTYRRDLWTRRSLGLVVLTAATASAGAYYAFFTCALLAVAGVYAWAGGFTWRAPVAALAVAALVVGFGVVNHVPTYLYQYELGKNPVTDRFPEEADHYGLKIAHMVLPIEDHYFRPFNKVKWMFNSSGRPAETENRSASLGVVGTAGLLGLAALAMLPFRRPWPYGPLVALTLFAVLLATIGGFGSVFNLVVSAQIRAYNRISVFIAFFCLFAFLWAFDTLWVRHPKGLPVRYAAWFAVGALAAATVGAVILDTGAKFVVLSAIGFLWLAPLAALGYLRLRAPEYLRRQGDRLRERALPAWCRHPAWAAVAVVGFVDETPYSWFRAEIVATLDESASRFRDDARYFAKIEETMSRGADGATPWVFCLPYCPFPETTGVRDLAPYEHSRGYVHTTNVAWSFGAIKGREADAWQRDVCRETNPDVLVKRLIYGGFDGLLIDPRGYVPSTELIARANFLYRDLGRQPTARLPEVNHADGRQTFLDLRPLRDVLRRLDPADYEQRSAREQEFVALIFLAGFDTTLGEPGDFYQIRYGTTDGSAWVVNPTGRTRTFTLHLVFGTEFRGAFRMELRGLVDDQFDLDKNADVTRDYLVQVPPGHHRVRIRCTPPDDFIPNDTRKWCYAVKHYWMTEH